jgi:hypothetical protein
MCCLRVDTKGNVGARVRGLDDYAPELALLSELLTGIRRRIQHDERGGHNACQAKEII